MTVRVLVIEDTGGAIRRTIIADPTMLSLQPAVGESLFVIVDDDGLFLNDAVIVVSEAGELALAEGAPEGAIVPEYELQYVAV